MKYLAFLIFINTSMLFNAVQADEFIIHTTFHRVGTNLYKQDHNVLFKVMAFSSTDRKSYLAFIKRLNVQGDRDKVGPELREVVDVDSWKSVTDILYIDKNNVYKYTYSLCGGELFMLKDTRPDNVAVLTENGWISYHAYIKEYYIFRGQEQYYTDGITVYYGSYDISEDVENFTLIQNNNEYDAVDAKFKYFEGEVIGERD